MIIDKKKLQIPILLLIIGIAFSIVSAIISLNAVENWFARSGAVLSFVSVVVQFMLSNMKKSEIEKLFESNLGLKQKMKALKQKDSLNNSVSAASIVTGLVGTIIWGYGDLFY